MRTNFAVRTILTAVDQASTVMKRIAKQSRSTTQALRSTRKAADAVGRVGTRAFAGMAIPAAAAARTSLNISKDFQTAQNAVFAAIDDATDEQREKLEQQSRTLGATTAFAASQAANAQEALAKAGFSVNQVLSSTPGTLSLAAASALELGDAASITTRAMDAFNIQAGDAGQGAQRIADVLTRGGNLANTTVSELSEALREAGPVANSFGRTLEQTVAELDGFAKAGFSGSQAGTAFRAGLVRLTGKSPEAEKALLSLGLQMKDFFRQNEDGSIQFLGYANAVERLGSAGANSVDMMKVFGEEAGPKLLALMNVGADGIREYEKALTSANGAAARAADTRLQGLPRVYAEMASAFEALNIAMEKSGGFDFIIEKAKQLTKWMQELSEQPEKLRPWIDIAKTVSGVAVAMIGLSVATRAALFAVFPLRLAFGGLAKAFALGRAAIAVASAGISAASALMAGKIAAETAGAAAAAAANFGKIDKRYDRTKKLLKGGLVIGAAAGLHSIVKDIREAADSVEKESERFSDAYRRITNPKGLGESIEIGGVTIPAIPSPIEVFGDLITRARKAYGRDNKPLPFVPEFAQPSSGPPGLVPGRNGPAGRAEPINARSSTDVNVHLKVESDKTITVKPKNVESRNRYGNARVGVTMEDMP